MSPNPLTDEKLQAFVDGRLDEAERRAVEALLAEDPDAAARAQAYRQQTEALHAAFDPVLKEPLPARLREARPGRAMGLRELAAAAVLLLIGGTGGWWANNWVGGPRAGIEHSLTGEAALAHRVYTKEVRHAVEVPADEEAHLVAWLSKRLDAPLAAPDLTGSGFELVGGRLLPASQGAAAHLMYENMAGDRLTLYVRTNREGGETAFRFEQDGEVSAFYWLDGPLAYAVLAEAEREILLPLARAVYNEISP